MAKLSVKPGSTSITLYVLIQDSTSITGAGLTGLVHNSSGLNCYYVRTRGVNSAITLATLAAANSAWSSGGFKEVSSANMPGVYRLDLPDAVCAASARSAVVMLKGATNMAPVVLEIDLSNDANVENWKGATAPAMTGDAFARLGAPSGASVSADIASIDPLTAQETADAVGTRVIEGTHTVDDILRIIAAALAGETSGSGTATVEILGLDGATTRITATVSPEGNRTAMTLDGAV